MRGQCVTGRTAGLASAIVLCGAISGQSFAQDAGKLPSQQEMWEMILRQQEEISELKQQVEANKGRVETTEQQAAATTAKVLEVERVANQSPSTPSEQGWWNRTSLGGYGELHYNGGDKEEIDFHRFVLFLGHEFNDRIRLYSELELEHALAGDGEAGEVELEQAFIEMDLTDSHALRAGVQLIPVGINVHGPWPVRW